ncbi:MAG: hypothetical protein MO847_03105 [Candidatus Protistobacter heckmanni]|nr:hypothetical protein [Candidatus Protistobacter heckmanni]
MIDPPETDPAVLAKATISAEEAGKALSELAWQGCSVGLHIKGRPEVPGFPADLIDASANAIQIRVTEPAPGEDLPLVFRSPEVVVVITSGQSKYQFNALGLRALSLRPQVREGERPRAYLECAMPAEVARIQRRKDKRVAMPSQFQTRIVVAVRGPTGEEVHCLAMDCLPNQVPARVGSVLAGCQIIAGKRRTQYFDLQVGNVGKSKNVYGMVRLGCQLLNPSDEVQRHFLALRNALAEAHE